MALQQVGPVDGRGTDVDEDFVRTGIRVRHLSPYQLMLGTVLVHDDGIQNDGTPGIMLWDDNCETTGECSAIIIWQASSKILNRPGTDDG